jgi:AraC-like DNA-binding protein
MIIFHRLAELLGTEVRHGRIDIPERLGRGYCAGYAFNEQLQMMVFDYELKEDVILENPAVEVDRRRILFKFQKPAVLIATSSMHTEAVIPVHSNVGVINVEVDAGYLRGILPMQSEVVKRLLENEEPLLFEQLVNPGLQRVIDEVMEERVYEGLGMYFLRVKAEELICRLLMELEKRDEEKVYALNGEDVKAIYGVKMRMLERLDVVPVIGELAEEVNMSPTKLKRLFRQVFGDSVFSYYQGFRMKEAARLLREERLAVAEAGYRMGFSNMSHFARVFEEHIGMKPKQFSKNV